MSIEFWTRTAEASKDFLETIFKEMTAKVGSSYGALPNGDWVKFEGPATTPRGVVESLNWKRSFTDGYEAIFYSASGSFIVTKDGEQVEVFHTRY